MLSPPVTGFVTVARGLGIIYGSGATVEEAREQAVDAIRELCVRTFPDDAKAKREFKRTVDDLTTYAATAALSEAVERGPFRNWEIHDGAACTYVEAHRVEPEMPDLGIRFPSP